MCCPFVTQRRRRRVFFFWWEISSRRERVYTDAHEPWAHVFQHSILLVFFFFFLLLRSERKRVLGALSQQLEKRDQLTAGRRSRAPGRASEGSPCSSFLQNYGKNRGERTHTRNNNDDDRGPRRRRQWVSFFKTTQSSLIIKSRLRRHRRRTSSKGEMKRSNKRKRAPSGSCRLFEEKK